MRSGTAAIGAALFTLGSVVSNPCTLAGPTRLIQPQPVLTAQTGAGSSPPAGFESTVAPALVVQPGPPPAPLGETQVRRPFPPDQSRPALPNYESDAGAANLRIGPSFDSPVESEQHDPGKEAGTMRERQP